MGTTGGYRGGPRRGLEVSRGEGSRDAGVTPGQDYRGYGGHRAATEVPGGGYSAYGCRGGL